MKKQLSDLQKANLLIGQLFRRCSCTSELAKLLKEEGFPAAAADVENAYRLGRLLAHRKGKWAIEDAKARRADNKQRRNS